MPERIDWDKIFNFSGDSPLQKVIADMNELIDVSNKMVTTLVTNNNKLETELKATKVEAGELANNLKKMNTESKGAGTQLDQAAKKASTLSGNMVALNQVQADNAKTVNTLTKEVVALEKAKAAAEKITINERNSLNDLKAKLIDADKAYRALGDSSNKSVKDEHLKKVKELSGQFNAMNKTLSEAKKGHDAVKGSYDELTQRVVKAKHELKGLGDGFDKNSVQVKALKKFIKEGSDQLKEFDKSIGDNQRSVGDYGIATQALDGHLGGLVTRLKGVGAAFGAAFANPFVLAATALVGTFIALKNASETYYKISIEGEEALEAIQLQRQAQARVYEKEWAKLGKNVGNFWQQIKDGAKGAVFFFSPQAIKDQVNDVSIAATKLSDDIAKNRKAHLDDTIDDAKTELQVMELIEKSKDKLHVSDQERLAANREAERLLIEQMEGDLELAEEDVRIQKEQIRLFGETIESRKKLTELEVALTNIQTAAASKRISLGKVEAALVAEIESDKKAALKASQDLDKVADKAKLERNKKIAADEKAFQDGIVANFMKSEKDRIEEAEKIFNDFVDQQELVQGLSLSSQLEYLEERLELARSLGLDTIEVEKEIAKLRFAIQKEDHEKVLSAEEALNTALLQLRGQAIQTAQDILFNSFDREAARIDSRMAHLETQQAKELELAGDNADAKARIESNYAAQINALENEQRAIRRKKAIGDKLFAAFQIGINTATAIVKGLADVGPVAGIPLGIVVGAIGALQLASVLTAPIPELWTGTDSSDEGLHWVAERGREMAVEPSGKARLYDTDGATLTYLKAGTTVYDHEDTEKILAGGDFSEVTKSFSPAKIDRAGMVAGSPGVPFNDSRIVRELKKNRPSDFVRIHDDLFEVKRRKEHSRELAKRYIHGHA